MYTPKGFKNEITDLFDDLADTAVSYGFKKKLNGFVGDLKQITSKLPVISDVKPQLEGLRKELDDLKNPDLNSEMHSELTKKVDFFFNNLDQKLYNLETLNKVKQNILGTLPEYANLEFELEEECSKLETKEHYAWLGYGFGKGAVITGVAPAVALSFVFPPLIPICALSGFWGGVWGVDTQDRKFTEKYDLLVNKRKELIEEVLNV